MKTGNVLGLMAIDLNCEDGAKLQRYVEIKPPYALIKTQEDARMRLFVCGGAGWSYNRVEIAALPAICRSLDNPCSETYSVWQRCRAIVKAWRDWTTREEAEGVHWGTRPPIALKEARWACSKVPRKNWLMAPALMVDGALAKARAFETFSLIDKRAERIREEIGQSGVFELEVIALSFAFDLFSLAKTDVRS